MDRVPEPATVTGQEGDEGTPGKAHRTVRRGQSGAFFGAYKSERRAENLAILDDLFAGFSSLPFDGAAAREFGRIRADLQRVGTPIGPYDLQIAAIALAHNLTLVTHNTDEFKRVSALQIDDWEAS